LSHLPNPRLVLRLALAILLCADFVGCTSLPTYPRPMCLYDDTRHTRWRKGTAITSRGDGAILFEFDDQTEGDKGHLWFIAVGTGPRLIDERGRELALCTQSSFTDQRSPF
jgi:hypothetical protein